MEHDRWLLLLHQIPPKPPYFRAKVLRRLNQIGALPIKNSAYVLPATDEALEDLQWVRREIAEEGGEAWLFETELLDGLTDDQIREAFRSLRATDYSELLEAGHKLLDELRGQPKAGDKRSVRVMTAAEYAELVEAGHDPLEDADAFASTGREAEFRKLKRRWDEVRRIDFFSAPGSQEMETVMSTLDRILSKPAAKPPAGQPSLAGLRGQTWVTRRGVKVDRIASSWLISRFLDPEAKFVFVDPGTYAHTSGEIRFDMFEGEFTHEGELCTFEVLLARSSREDPSLRAVAEVVHDIDLKDHKYQRPETAGVAALIDGLTRRHADDLKRLEEGLALFDSLYARLG